MMLAIAKGFSQGKVSGVSQPDAGEIGQFDQRYEYFPMISIASITIALESLFVGRLRNPVPKIITVCVVFAANQG